MITRVFKDLKSFLTYYIFVMITFGLLFSVIFEAPASDSEGLGPISYVLMSLRIVWGGSFEVDKTELKVIAWISYIMLMVIGNIVLLNFLIAVVNQSYESSMQKVKLQIFKVRLTLIESYYKTLDEEAFNDKSESGFVDIFTHPRGYGKKKGEDNDESDQ